MEVIMEPQIHFSTSDIRKWEGKATYQLHEEMDSLRVKVRDASGYRWDNSHFFIDDGFGKPALKVLFYGDGISFWNARNGVALDTFTRLTWAADTSEAIREWVDKIEKGLTRCQDCKGWVKHINHFDFAGGVCDKCYNPKIHLPPDTRGD
jgi:hypothetical protein